MQNTIEAMTAIERSSRQITESVNLITDIADQTIVFALNAAIEGRAPCNTAPASPWWPMRFASLPNAAPPPPARSSNLIEESAKQVKDGAQVSRGGPEFEGDRR